MTFFNDKFVMVTNSAENFYMFQHKKRYIYLYYFNPRFERVEKTVLADDVFKDFDVSIDENDVIYVIYQNDVLSLILLILDGNSVERIKLTKDSILEVYNLNIINYKKNIHIIYCEKLLDNKNYYMIYHHFFDGENWFTNDVKGIKVKNILNPFQIVKSRNHMFLGYYDSNEEEEIYMKNFDCGRKIWEQEYRLTEGDKFKLYLDFLIIDGKISLVYSEEFEGNFIIKYEKYSLSSGNIIKEIEETMSNPGSCSHPTLVFFNGKLWTIWLEYDCILSRYSEDGGNTWSPIYLWNESKRIDIVRYKYLQNNGIKDVLLNASFGKVYPNVTFMGFGPLENTTKVPLKKKNSESMESINIKI